MSCRYALRNHPHLYRDEPAVCHLDTAKFYRASSPSARRGGKNGRCRPVSSFLQSGSAID